MKNAVVESSDSILKFEVLMFVKNILINSEKTNEEKNLTLKGLIDIETENTVWEIKCVQNLTDEHFIQLGIYAWLYEKQNLRKNSIL